MLAELIIAGILAYLVLQSKLVRIALMAFLAVFLYHYLTGA